MGEWLTNIASIKLIDKLHGDNMSRTAISLLVTIRLMPSVLFSPAGGASTDSRDRRESMITLELVGAFIALYSIFWHTTPSPLELSISSDISVTDER
jgi:hypothetical protein